MNRMNEMEGNGMSQEIEGGGMWYVVVMMKNTENKIQIK